MRFTGTERLETITGEVFGVLRSFRLGNHRSFRDEQELLLMPSMPGDERPVVPVAAIYGANASGKSNLFNGLWFMQAAVRDSLAAVCPVDFFRLGNEGADKPSSYIAELVVDAVRHTYGFSVQAGVVQEEWLYSYPEKRKRVVFERESGQIRFGSTVSDLKAKFATLNELIRPEALILGACGQLQLGPLMPVYQWFDQALRIDSIESEANDVLSERIGAFVQRSPEHARRLLSLLAAADVGIADIAVDRVNEPIRARSLSYATFRPASKPDRVRWKVRLRHGSQGAPFDLRDESAGTLNWLGLLPTVLDVLDAGQVFVVDEIDTSLHPMLTAKLIDLFQNPVTNPHSAQMVFTTHDTSLLGTMLGDHVLDRDQVWFVEKGPDGASELYPLTDFKPRKDQNTERRYLAGSYGAVPVLDGTSFSDAILGR